MTGPAAGPSAFAAGKEEAGEEQDPTDPEDAGPNVEEA